MAHDGANGVRRHDGAPNRNMHKRWLRYAYFLMAHLGANGAATAISDQFTAS